MTPRSTGAVRLAALDGEVTGWDPPAPLTEQIVPPPFPIDALPDWMGEFVTGVSTSTQTPPDMAAMLGLAMLATVTGRRALFQVTADWSEPACLYVVVLARSGERKSAVFDELTAPLDTYQLALIEETRQARSDARTELFVLGKRVQAAKESAAKASKPSERSHLLNEAKTLAAELDELTEPPEPCVYVGMSTPEHLADVLVAQGGRLAQFADEGGAIDLISRYSNLGSGPNMDVYLAGHPATGTYKSGTISRGRREVRRPTLTVGFAVQPTMIDRLAAIDGAIERGLLARFLFSYPQSLVGYRSCNPVPLRNEVRNRYHRELIDLARHLAGLAPDSPFEVTFSSEAREVVFDFLASIEPRLRPDGGDLSHVASWASKLGGAVVRIAGLLHLADGWRNGACTTSIDSHTVLAAIQIGDYLVDHARLVLGDIGVAPEVKKARVLLKLIDRKDLTTFSVPEMWRSHVTRPSRQWQEPDDLRATCDYLCEYGHLRRNLKRYDVSPLIRVSTLSERPNG